MEESRLVNWIVDEGIGMVKKVTRTRVSREDLCGYACCNSEQSHWQVYGTDVILFEGDEGVPEDANGSDFDLIMGGYGGEFPNECWGFVFNFNKYLKRRLSSKFRVAVIERKPRPAVKANVIRPIEEAYSEFWSGPRRLRPADIEAWNRFYGTNPFK